MAQLGSRGEVRSLTSKLFFLLLLEVLHIALVENDFLDLFFWQEAREEAGRGISGRELWQVSAVAHERLRVCSHLILEHEEVHDLMEHCEGTRLRSKPSLAHLRQLARRLLCVYFERSDSLPEHAYLLIYAFQVIFEISLQRFERLLLRQLSLGQPI